MSLEQGATKPALGRRHCSGCGADTYEGSLRCHGCKAKSEICIVSGCPVLAGEKITCGSALAQHCARRAEWNQYVGKFGTCPWCGVAASAKY